MRMTLKGLHQSSTFLKGLKLMSNTYDNYNWKFSLLFVLFIALIIYCWAHRTGFTNEYLINDDVRHQIFWMQQWQEPELYPDNLLLRYAKNYVPWGVTFVYYIGSPLINPVQFTKVTSGVIFLITAGFLFGIGCYLKDDLTGILLVCTMFLSTHFLDKMAGGLSRGFAYPLLTGYLFFLARRNLSAAGVMILLLSLFNPYIMLLCLVTHGLFLGKCWLPIATRRLIGLARGDSASIGAEAIKSFLLVNLPVTAGVFLMALRYMILKDNSFGELATWSDMAGKIEYTAASGRCTIVPVPSLLWEMFRPIASIFPFSMHKMIGLPAGAIITVVASSVFIYWRWVWRSKYGIIPYRRLWVFTYLLPASVIMYVAAYIVLMRLFIPGRYVEYPFTIFYCVLIAFVLRTLFEIAEHKRLFAVLAVSIAIVVGAVRLDNVAMYDYSKYEPLCRFFRTVPRTSLVAGPPDIMDNTITFARRNAFLTHELFHAWYLEYWKKIKERTYAFCRAYYASEPEEIRHFSRANGIDYIVFRKNDFPPESLSKGPIHMEPFDTYARNLARLKSKFAMLDRNAFPIVFENDELVVLNVRQSRSH